MTIGIYLMKALLIQAVGLAFQAATATPVVSTTMGASGTGGLRQSLVPSRGDGYCTTATTMSSETASIGTTAFLLVASGIKNFKL